jgi:hypothetical protein
MLFLNKNKFVRPQEMSRQSDKLSVSSEATKDPENLYLGWTHFSTFIDRFDSVFDIV